MDRRFSLAVLLLLVSSCSLLASLYVANLSPHPIHVEFTVPCDPWTYKPPPYCPSPTFLSVPQLRHGGGVDGSPLAPASVQQRIDSLVTYSLELPPHTAVRLLGVAADGAGNVLYPKEQLRGMRITVDTGMHARTYEGVALKAAFKKWRKTVHVLEVP